MRNNGLKRTIDIISKHIGFLRGAFHVRTVGIFGSTVRGRQRRHSDVDVLIEFSEPIGFFKFIELENFLSKILGKKVDAVTKNALKPAIKKDILKEAVYV